MKGKILLRILLALVGVCLLLFLGWIGLIFSIFSIHGEFYSVLVAILTFLLIIWIIVWATKTIKWRYMYISFFIIIGASIISSSIYHIHRNRIMQIPVMTEQENHLWDYRPFLKDTKTVTLDEPSNLRFTDDLPAIDGATALYPLYAAFVKATYPSPEEMEFPILYRDSIDMQEDERIKYIDEDGFYQIEYGHVRGSTTPKAYNALIYGNADVIFCARPSRQQLEEIKETGKELHMTPIGREAFVFFVNTQNPVEGLTQQQIRDIYSGKIRNWKQVGGKNQSIRAFQRPEGSGSQTMLLHIMGDTPLEAPPEENMVGGMGGIINRTARYRNYNNAIGYSFLFFTTEMVGNNQIKLLEVDGIIPNKTTITNDTYPFSGDFYAITLGEPKPNVKILIDWILSEQGQKLVEKTGYVPIESQEK